LIILLCLLLLGGALLAGGAAFAYYSLDETAVPNLSVALGTAALSPDSYDWSEPVFLLGSKAFSKSGTGKTAFAGTSEGEGLPLKVPKGYGALVTVSHLDENGREITDFEGSPSEYAGFSFPDSGSYNVDIYLTKEPQENEGSGRFHFRGAVEVEIPPPPVLLVHTEDTVIQGDVFAFAVKNVPEGVVPSAESEVSKISLAREGEDWVGCVPISYMREPGTYTVTVRCGEELEETLSFQVEEGEFEVQELTIDTSPSTNPQVAQASSPAAYAQYREAIYPLYETADGQIYWSGNFIEPVEGYRISTPYGVKRYTNGAATPSRHAGVDMAIGLGTPVKAPATGRVVFAQYLLNTGNTVAIEHGAGLKTFYFHMDSLAVSEGETVEQGQKIGEVGTTGYSTGPHLHFEMRIANQAIDPFLMFEGKNALYRIGE